MYMVSDLSTYRQDCRRKICKELAVDSPIKTFEKIVNRRHPVVQMSARPSATQHRDSGRGHGLKGWLGLVLHMCLIQHFDMGCEQFPLFQFLGSDGELRSGKLSIALRNINFFDKGG